MSKNRRKIRKLKEMSAPFELLQLLHDEDRRIDREKRRLKRRLREITRVRQEEVHA